MSPDEEEIEKMNARAEFAAGLHPFLSAWWIRKHVFRLTDTEIAAIERAEKE